MRDIIIDNENRKGATMTTRLLKISVSVLILGAVIYSTGCEKKADASVQEPTAKACPADCTKPCCIAETVWTCSMHPQIKEEKAGKCDICEMDLVALAPDSDAEKACPADCTKPCCADKSVEAVSEQTLCPVMGNPINKEIFIEYKGKKVYFCCPGCDEKFTAAPEKYLEKLPQFE
jgi:YHS domain-containing protein